MLTSRLLMFSTEVAPFGDGHSGFTYRVVVSHDGERAERVLRLSPPGARIAGPADIGRQGRVMDAIGRAGLPAPPVVAGQQPGESASALRKLSTARVNSKTR